jgi:hypothetical protein
LFKVFHLISAYFLISSPDIFISSINLSATSIAVAFFIAFAGAGTYTCIINSLELQQQYLSGSGLAFSLDNYFITNSANLGVITASLSMSAFYNYYQQGIAGSGFNPITNLFKIKVGDEIRFENDESKTYFIYMVWHIRCTCISHNQHNSSYKNKTYRL